MKKIHLIESRFRSLIMEAMDINDIHTKYYSDIPYNEYLYIVKFCDPTYDSALGKMGKYTKWLLGMYRRGTFKRGDFDEARRLLPIYEKYKNRVQVRDVTQLHSMGELYQVVRPFMEGDQATSKSDAIRKAKQGAEKVYEDDQWLVIIPRTMEAAQIYGEHTKWCTAAENPDDNMFDYYNEQGPLYININKKDNRKYQFHFESESFMDEEDFNIDEPVFANIGASDGLLGFYRNLLGLKDFLEMCYNYELDSEQERILDNNKDGHKNLPDAYLVWEHTNNFCAYINSKGEVISPWFNDAAPFSGAENWGLPVAGVQINAWKGDYMTTIYGSVSYDSRNGSVDVDDDSWEDDGRQVYPYYVDYTNDEYGMWVVNEEDYEDGTDEDEDY